MPPPEVKAGILADWADTLEDWTQEQVLYGLRKWRNDNPTRKPNPGSILAILKETRGQAEVKRAALSKQEEPPRPKATPEERARMAEYAAKAGYAGPKRFTDDTTQTKENDQ